MRVFTYLPRNDIPNGVVRTCRIEVSVIGKDWSNGTDGEFGNMRNIPVVQEWKIADPVAARYFRFTWPSKGKGTDPTSAAKTTLLPVSP